MTKDTSKLPLQGAAYRTAIAHIAKADPLYQWRLAAIDCAIADSSFFSDLQRLGAAYSESPIAKDLERMRKAAESVGAAYLESPIAKDLERMRKAAEGVGAAYLESPIAKDLERMRKAAEGVGAAYLESPIAKDLERMRKAAESVGAAYLESPIAKDLERMRKAIGRSTLAKYLQRMTSVLGIQQQAAEAARRSLDFSPKIRLFAGLEVGFQQRLGQPLAEASVTAPALSQPRKRSAPSQPAKSGTVAARPPQPGGPVGPGARTEWRIKVFLAGLPFYFEPPDETEH